MKTRNMRAEGRRNAHINFIVLAAAAAAAYVILPEHGPIGTRSMLLLNILCVCGFLGFMLALEKYSALISGLYEKTVSTVLSAVYMFVIMAAINFVMFGDGVRLAADALLTGAGGLCVFCADAVFELYNERRCRRPKLIIIDTDSNNLHRMKRIKYGVLQKYDSWYENVGGITPGDFVELTEALFPRFDAVCILDGLSDAEYHIAVDTAAKLGKDLFIVPEMVDVGKTNAKIVCLDDILTLYMPKAELGGAELFLKRAADIVISLAGLAAALIPMAVIAAVVKATSPGPVIYKQTRYTRGKREFEIYKFRTMTADAEKISGPKFAEKNDPRITKAGRLLRSMRLDELPQLINVLRGDMSIVGPRPERPVFAERFAKEVERYNDRFEVKAGLTSLSHVYGRYSTYIHDRTYYDLFYITHYSPLLDLKILLLTTKTIFLRSAAEGEDDFKEKTVADNGKEVPVK